MPASPDSARRTLQSEYAAARRWQRPEADDLGRSLAEIRLADYITRVVDASPPLTEDQKDRLAVLLRGAAA